MPLLPLQKGILYGPIDSRRLGKSLGINLMPTNYKLCSFNCVYCHYGWTKVHANDVACCKTDLPHFDDVVTAVEEALVSKMQFDYLTFSGNGEPTLYPEFASLVSALVELRDKHRPYLKIALLSNSTGLENSRVRASIEYIDLPVFKLDAGTRDVFERLNRPAKGVKFETLVKRLQSLKGIFIQTVMVHGSPDNAGQDQLEKYFQHIQGIKPETVHVYSIDRPVPNQNIKRILPQELEEIARQGSRKTGVNIEAFYATG
jgi:wyosine [tRNA(Phe)-imidazoG37] synthetase (radical SAM superfamily)